MKENPRMEKRVTAVNLILALCLKIDRFLAGTQFFEKEIIAAKLQPDAYTYTAAIDLYSKAERNEDAVQLYSTMREQVMHIYTLS